MITGGLLTVLGVMFLRNLGAAAVTLTLLAGAFFLAGGIVRIVGAFENRAYLLPLLLSGVASTVLGLIVLFNLFAATLTLLGVLLGVQLLIDGVTMILVGRVRVRAEV